MKAEKMNYKKPSLSETTETGNNNKSRQLFAVFCMDNDVDRVDRSRNMFFGKGKQRGKKIAFAYCPTGMFCRQFYEDAEGLVVVTNSKIMTFDLSELIIDMSSNRVTANGVKAYTAYPKDFISVD